MDSGWRGITFPFSFVLLPSKANWAAGPSLRVLRCQFPFVFSDILSFCDHRIAQLADGRNLHDYFLARLQDTGRFAANPTPPGSGRDDIAWFSVKTLER